MGQRPSKLDRHGAELLALWRARASVAQLTRWLRFPRDTVVAMKGRRGRAMGRYRSSNACAASRSSVPS